ncbi:MAG: sigma-70 family RNA polymerase sigma factor [Planctomycetes bacterium]|nr:sigma-70 family RNA polymerase sigma factor [Planctomycetota bacterium]
MDQLDLNTVILAQGGDRASQELLWRRHRGWLTGVLMVHAPRGDEVDDLLQEVALQFVRRLPALDKPASLPAWLRRIAVNTSRDAARRRESRPVQAGDATADLSDLCAGEPGGGRTREILNHLAELPTRYREPLVLRAVKGLTQEAIAEILSISVPAVETRLSRARRMLRDRLVKEEIIPSPRETLP